MALKIPSNFDFKKIPLDPLEVIVRDRLNVNIENWAKFRHTINASVNANSLKSKSIILPEIKSSYIELSKSHYETVTMLGATRISLDTLINSQDLDRLIFKKSFKEFYMHAGSVIDNIARLIYIVNIARSTKEKGRHGLLRHEIGYGGLAGIYKKK